MRLLIEILLAIAVATIICKDYDKRRHLATISRHDARVLYQNAWIKGAEAMTKPTRPRQTWSIDSAAFE
jgi:hypothetical protein